MRQDVLKVDNEYKELDNYLITNNALVILLVCGHLIENLKINKYFATLENRLEIKVVKFQDFEPNPCYESVVEGVRIFRSLGCNMVIAVGGGSAIDVAKCIKIYADMDVNKNLLHQKVKPNEVKLLAVPTTAGSGSEATRFAVIYWHGDKQTITDAGCYPSAIMLDGTFLKTLPDYQKKVTMLDALCHAIEAFWSVNSTEESREYSREAIHTILINMNAYLANDETVNNNMLYAANIAGKAINIAQTTAGHALSYRISSMYGIAHGHAVALCVSKLWPYLISHIGNCFDFRGEQYVKNVFSEIADAMGCKSMNEAPKLFSEIIGRLNLTVPKATDDEIEFLVETVNITRLKNTPIVLDKSDIKDLYCQILKG